MQCSLNTWFFPSILCVALLSDSGCRIAPGERPPVGDTAVLPRSAVPWIEADSVDADVDAARVRIEAERLAAALPGLVGPLPSNLSPPWRVHIVKPDATPNVSGPERVSRGWTGFTRWGAGEAWVASAPGDSSETLRRLRHELTHVVLESTVGSGPGFPLWLQEGVPCCFETGVLPDGVPRPNQPRLRQLQFFLRARHGVIDLDAFLNRRADQPYSSNDYAVAWGLVYTLAANRVGPNGQEWLKACLGAAGAAARLPGKDVTAAVREAFDRELRKRDLTFRQWERRWRRTVMRLGARWPFGVLR